MELLVGFGISRPEWPPLRRRFREGVPVRVLIVEDDPFVALDLESIVQDTAEVEVDVVASVAEARKHVSGIDFAFLDIDVLDGAVFEVAELLRDRGVPFAFVTGAARACVPAPLRDAPFIPKPYKVWQISRSLLETAGAERAWR
ncbi:MAG: Response regulator receiver protein [Hyphomicrobiales bacterium]|jgi:DNA-binding LytR/AlgR family response regulator|nr:Response regulator receiver protein [Hyphomicrobiales bacterium]